MKLTIGEHAGFCFGVRRAVDKAFDCAKQQLPCVTLGPLIHNPQEVRRLESAGVAFNILCVLTEDAAMNAETVLSALSGYPYLQFIPCMDARRGQLYNAIFSCDGEKLTRLTPDRAISLDELASIAHFEKSYLTVRFKQMWGISPMKYVNLLRIERAKLLLATTDMSITDIACCVGFGSIHYFSRYFKEKEGITPNEYRIERQKPLL